MCSFRQLQTPSFDTKFTRFRFAKRNAILNLINSQFSAYVLCSSGKKEFKHSQLSCYCSCDCFGRDALSEFNRKNPIIRDLTKFTFIRNANLKLDISSVFSCIKENIGLFRLITLIRCITYSTLYCIRKKEGPVDIF